MGEEPSNEKEPMSLGRRAFVGGSLIAMASLALDGSLSNRASSPTAEEEHAAELRRYGVVPSTYGKGLTVMDALSREVELPEYPERIVCLDYFSCQLLVACGAGPRLVAVPAAARANERLLALHPHLAELPAFDDVKPVALEDIEACNPDVILLNSTSCISSPQAAQDSQYNLDNSRDIPSIAVEYSTVEEHVEAIEMIGSICGGKTQERAQALAGYYHLAVEECSQRTQGIPVEERVRVYHANAELMATDGKRALGGDWIAKAGCINVSVDSEMASTPKSRTVSWELLYRWDPDVILCNKAETVDYLMTAASSSALRAVTQEICLQVPRGIVCWGQEECIETCLAMLWLACSAYPQAFADIDLQQRAADFYRDCLGIQISAQQCERVISGEGLDITETQGGPLED